MRKPSKDVEQHSAIESRLRSATSGPFDEARVATEADRIRAAVVDELRFSAHWLNEEDPAASLQMRADYLEKGKTP